MTSVAQPRRHITGLNRTPHRTPPPCPTVWRGDNGDRRISAQTSDTQTSSERERKRTIVAAVAEVATHLGNTPAVCRSAHIDPRVIDCFEGGDTMAETPTRAKGDGEAARRRVEAAVIEMLTRFAQAA
jgi:DNA topoisomerase IB